MKAKLVWLILLGANAWPAADMPLQWVTFQDSFEHAFTADVPKGWTAKGGLFRLGYSDARPMVDLTSPDGRINIRLGDVAIPVYFVPNQFHREGEIYDLGAQAQLTVAHYRPGPEFAAAYAKARFENVCANLRPQSVDAGPPMRDYAPEDTAPQKSSDGQGGYLCGFGRDAKAAYVYAKTSLYQGFWTVRTLGSFSAPADQVSRARVILLRCSESFRISPEWTQHQKELDREALAYQRQRRQRRMRQLSRQVAEFEWLLGQRQRAGDQLRHLAGSGLATSEGSAIIDAATSTRSAPTPDPCARDRRETPGYA